MPILEFKILEIHSFLHFSPTCFGILSWNFVYDFQWMNIRWSSSVINFCKTYAPFGTKNTRNTQFSTLFSMCFDILSWNFVYDFHLMNFRLKYSIINFRNNTPFGTENTWNTVFHTLSLHVLTNWADMLYITFYELQIKWLSIPGVMLKELCPLWIYRFAHYSCACSEIELNLLIWLFFLLYIILSVKCIINDSLLEFSWWAYCVPIAVLWYILLNGWSSRCEIWNDNSQVQRYNYIKLYSTLMNWVFDIMFKQRK